MNIENAKSQMRKGMLEYCVLLLLKHRPSYASDIIQQLKNAESLVVEGTLYPLLTRLKNDGLLSYEWQESTQGPPRKYYALSPEGEQIVFGHGHVRFQNLSFWRMFPCRQPHVWLCRICRVVDNLGSSFARVTNPSS